MVESPPAEAPLDLAARLEALGHALGAREAEHAEALSAARSCAEQLRERVVEGLERFHGAAKAEGAAHLRVEVGEIRIDDKHLRAVEFDLARGRHRAIVTVKSRGQVTLVGPFHQGKAEGPCLSFPIDARQDVELALGTFLEKFLEEAATP
jgi:hypothetical protein